MPLFAILKSRILITHDKHVLCPGPTGTGKSPLVLLLFAQNAVFKDIAILGRSTESTDPFSILLAIVRKGAVFARCEHLNVAAETSTWEFPRRARNKQVHRGWLWHSSTGAAVFISNRFRPVLCVTYCRCFCELLSLFLSDSNHHQLIRSRELWVVRCGSQLVLLKSLCQKRYSYQHGCCTVAELVG